MPQDTKIKIAGVYTITHLASGRAYVGESLNTTWRLARHQKDLKANIHYNNHLQNAWNKYGEDAFEFKVFLLIPSDIPRYELKKKLKQQEIKVLNLFPLYYNIMEPGQGCLVLSKEGREKLGKASKAAWKNPEFRHKRMTGMAKSLSDPVIKKNRDDAVRVALNKPEYKENASKRFKKMWQDPELKAQAAAKRKTYYADPENRDKHKKRMQEWADQRKFKNIITKPS